ncbi:hypothetical protein SK128_009281, partial [Halocaridina rubra]
IEFSVLLTSLLYGKKINNGSPPPKRAQFTITVRFMHPFYSLPEKSALPLLPGMYRIAINTQIHPLEKIHIDRDSNMVSPKQRGGSSGGNHIRDGA